MFDSVFFSGQTLVEPSIIFNTETSHQSNMEIFQFSVYKMAVDLLMTQTRIKFLANEFMKYLVQSRHSIMEKDFFDFLEGVGKSIIILS